uniref:Ig-like domain-containing protein n=1 Tax=Amphiprion percula TaxID=161767 RepID=A0A3P8SAZ3_AMPPE
MIFMVFIFSFLHLPGNKGASDTKHIYQTPPAIIKRTSESVDGEIKCSHNITNHQLILWYKQDKHKALKFLGYLNVNLPPNIEEDVKGKISFDGDETDLEVTPPTNVKILPPSPNECRNQKDKKRKKTLVCVASGFYPDHVEVLWKSNGKEAKDGVATDSAAKRVDKFYRITSRLRVPAEDYNTASNTFTCIVSFFDGEKKILREASINGTQGKTEGGMTREKYLRLTQSAKLSYTVVIVKSCFYGVFVGVLVWKLQGSARKHH